MRQRHNSNGLSCTCSGIQRVRLSAQVFTERRLMPCPREHRISLMRSYALKPRKAGLSSYPFSILSRCFLVRPANHEKNVSRVLDLDLIALGEVISQSEALTLPHPRAAQRDFVLQPIVEIWPDYRLPGFEASASELLAQLGSSPLQYWECA